MKHRTFMTGICFFVLFLLGVEAGGFQISLLQMVDHLGFDTSASGWLVSAQYGAIVVIPFWVGRIADRKGKRLFLAVFGFIFSLGCIAMSSLQSLPALLVSAFVVGSGYSVSESIACALLAEMHQEKTGKYLNLSQVFFSLGAMVSPQIMKYGAQHFGWDYRSMFILCAIAGICVAVLAALEIRNEETVQPQAQETSAAINKVILLLVLAMFIYNCLDSGVGYYLDGFAKTVMKTPSHAADMLSLLYFFMIIGRLVCGMLYRFRKQLLYGCFLGAALMLGCLVCFPTLYVGYLCFSLLGFFMASIWPNIMALGMESFQGNAAQASGIISIGGGAGAVFAPMMLGAVMDGAGLRIGFGVMGLLPLLGMLLCAAYYRTGRKKPDPSVSENRGSGID